MNQFLEEFVKKAFLVFLVSIFFTGSVKSQTLVINEFSNGPSGSQEYLELIVIDTSASISCNPCIDIRGWIIDDNNGYHGSSGIASGCNRFSNDAFWSCIPYGTIITLYNGSDPNVDLPTNDFDLNDGNCSLVMPIENSPYFETNPSTPGGVACSYPSTGWVAGGVWSRIGMRNGGDCIRVVDLTGCEVFSLSYGDITANSTIYFPGSGTDDVFYFSGNDPYNQSDWLQGCAGDPGACAGNDQTPGAFNSNLNDDYISQFRVNNCQLIEPLNINVSTTDVVCNVDGTATSTVSSGGVAPYFYDWYDENFQAIGQTNNTAFGLSPGLYYCIVTPTYGCADTVQANVDLSVAAPYVTASNQVNTCDGSCSGSITVQGQFGTSPYSYYYGDPYAAGNTPINPVPTASPVQLDNLCSGTYIVSVIDQNGCTGDNITFTINTELNSESTTDLTICENDLPFIWNGLTFNNSDSQIATLPALNGCDSLTTLNLTVISEFTGLETHTGCIGDGYSVEVNGNTYDELNPTGTEILLSSAGCDSTIIVNLTFNNNTTGNETFTGCSGDGYSVLVNGTTYDESNPSGTETMSNIFGCDSTISIDLTFNSPSSGSEVHTGCNGDGYAVTVNGIIYNEANPTGFETLSNINGCDSVVSIDLTFNSSITGNESYTGCSGDGYSVVVNGTTYDEANPSGTETLTAVAACDSIVTVDLVFNAISSSTDVQSACDTYTWIDANTYTASNNSATWVLSSVSGCDSTVTLDLTITNSNTETDTKSACDTYTWIDGNTYTANNNSATWILTNIDGCDSLVTLDLTINTSPTLIDFTNGGIYCEGEVVNGLVAEVSGVPEFTLDYTLNGNPLSISSSSSSIDVGSLAGEYTLNALTDNYCTTTLNQSQTIVINPNPDIPSLAEDAIYCSNAVPEAIQATGSTGSYNWYVDAAMTELLVTADEYTPDMILGSYTYYVTASENGCEGLPAEVSITFKDCQIIIPTAFTPDNDQVNDFWELGNIDVIYPKNVVSVYNRWGNKIYESDQGAYDERPWKGDYNGNFLPVGSYYYILEFNDNVTGDKTGIVSILK